MSEPEISFSNSESDLDGKKGEAVVQLSLSELIKPAPVLSNLFSSGPLSEIKLPTIRTLTGEEPCEPKGNERENDLQIGHWSQDSVRMQGMNRPRQQQKDFLDSPDSGTRPDPCSRPAYDAGDRRRRHDLQPVQKRNPRIPTLSELVQIDNDLPHWANCQLNPHTASFLSTEGKHTKIGVFTRTMPFGPSCWAPRKQYHRRRNENKTVVSWKRRGALLEDIEFLACETVVVRNDGMTEFVPTICLYIGASDGQTYIPILAHMFPHVIFEIYDPNVDFPCDMGANVIPHLEPFTDVTAIHVRRDKRFQERRFVFISRIRSASGLGVPRLFVEDYIDADMRAQLRWFEFLLPYAASLKIRFSWDKGSTWYAPGILSYSIYCPPTSTNTRMIIETNTAPGQSGFGNFRTFARLCESVIGQEILGDEVHRSCLSIYDSSRCPCSESTNDAEEADNQLAEYVAWLKGATPFMTEPYDLKPVTRQSSDIPALAGMFKDNGDVDPEIPACPVSLVVNGNEPEGGIKHKLYDHTVYEENLFYFNTTKRTECFPSHCDCLCKECSDTNDQERKMALMDWGVLDHCYDCSCEARILAGYIVLLMKSKLEQCYISGIIGNIRRTHINGEKPKADKVNPFDDGDDIKLDESDSDIVSVNEEGKKEVACDESVSSMDLSGTGVKLESGGWFSAEDLKLFRSKEFAVGVISLSKLLTEKMHYLLPLISISGSGIVQHEPCGAPTCVAVIPRENKTLKYNFFCLFGENIKDVHRYDGRMPITESGLPLMEVFGQYNILGDNNQE